MIRQFTITALAALALGGCASDYAYRGGAGDYYYGQPSVQYYDYGYGAPYGSLYGYPGGWSGGLGIGYGGYGYGGYGYGYPGYGYPYGWYGGYSPYYPPYYWHRRHDHDHGGDRPPDYRRVMRTGGDLPMRVRSDAPPPPGSSLRALRENGEPPFTAPVARPGGGRDVINQPGVSNRLQRTGGGMPMIERRPGTPAMSPSTMREPPRSAPSRPSPPMRERERVRIQEP